MRKSKDNTSLPRLRIFTQQHQRFNVIHQNQYARPKLKFIKYSPLPNIKRNNEKCLLADSCVQNRNYQQIVQEKKQKAIDTDLKYDIEPIIETRQSLLIGKDAQMNYYEAYKKLQQIKQNSSIQNSLPNAFTAVLEKSKSLSILPCCVGLVKYKGDPTVLNVSNFNLGNKYAQAMAAGLKQAKMIESCQISRNRLTQKGVEAIMKSISHDVNYIDLSHNKIRKIDQTLLNLIIENESRLQKLNLENNLLGDKSIQALCRSASYSKHLKYLNIRKNMLTSECADEIQNLILKTESLQQLYIGTNRIFNAGAEKILIALTQNKSIKVFDFSFNKLGEGKKSVANTINDLFKNNDTLLHVDFSSNNFSKEESAIIAQGLATNKKIYGIHFKGNFGYIDSKGFLVLQQKQQTTLHSIIDLQINSYQLACRRQQTSFQPSLFKNVCWICQGWRQQQFRFVIPPEVTDQKNFIVFLHFDFELYEPRLINLTERNVKYKAMVPPKTFKYFFTFNKQQHLDTHNQNVSTYEIPLQFTYEMNHEPFTFQVSKVNVKKGKAQKIVDPWDQLLIKSVKPRSLGLVSKKQKKIWQYKDSMWSKQWRLEDEQMTKKCFEKDWKTSKIPNLIKNNIEQQKVKDILYKNYKLIKQIYRIYSAWSPFGDIWAISTNSFTQFCHQSKISRDTELKIIDLTFITTNSMSGIDWKGNSLVPERGLVRFQFMQSLVRLSDQKYKKTGLYDNYFDSISMLMKSHINPLANQFAAQKWRLQKYFIEQNDLLIKKYRPIFTHVYKKNSKAKVTPGTKPFMCLAQFKSINERIGVLGTIVQEREILISFNCSMMTQIDQYENQRFMRMTQIQFIEAMARVAAQLPNTCKIESDMVGQVQLYHKFQWIIHQLKNYLCSDDIKSKYPNQQTSIFSVDEEDD